MPLAGRLGGGRGSDPRWTVAGRFAHRGPPHLDAGGDRPRRRSGADERGHEPDRRRLPDRTPGPRRSSRPDRRRHRPAARGPRRRPVRRRPDPRAGRRPGITRRRPSRHPRGRRLGRRRRGPGPPDGDPARGHDLPDGNAQRIRGRHLHAPARSDPAHRPHPDTRPGRLRSHARLILVAAAGDGARQRGRQDRRGRPARGRFPLAGDLTRTLFTPAPPSARPCRWV